MVLEGGASGRKLGHGGGALTDGISVLIRGRKDRSTLSLHRVYYSLYIENRIIKSTWADRTVKNLQGKQPLGSSIAGIVSALPAH